MINRSIDHEAIKYMHVVLHSTCQQIITLMQSGNFSDGRATSVQGGQEEGAYQLKFVINPHL